jgi:hypothetical protein
LIELAQVILDQTQFFQRERKQSTVDRMQRRGRLEGIAQLFGRGAQARGGQRGDGGWIGFAVGERLQHATGADAQQVRDDTRHLEVRERSSGKVVVATAARSSSESSRMPASMSAPALSLMRLYRTWTSRSPDNCHDSNTRLAQPSPVIARRSTAAPS